MLQIMPDFVINRKAPIIMGVEVLDGQLKMGTPICVPAKEVSFSTSPNAKRASRPAKLQL
jgi:translation initiation factor IF-2